MMMKLILKSVPDDTLRIDGDTDRTAWKYTLIGYAYNFLNEEPYKILKAAGFPGWYRIFNNWIERKGRGRDLKSNVDYLVKIIVDAESLDELQSILRPPGEGIGFSDYTDLYVQRYDRYSVKPYGGTWHTKKKYLGDRPILAHLRGQYVVGTLARWYPQFGLLDFDDKSREFVETVRDSLGMNEDNSMLFTSESPNSYHLIFRPLYNGKPPTRRLFKNVLRDHADRLSIEVFPQDWKTIRLPFGPKQICLDDTRLGLNKWEDATYWFQKLDDYDISNLQHQMMIDLKIPAIGGHYTLNEGKVLFENGLQGFGTRHESQFMVIYYLFRQNIPPNVVCEMVKGWIKNKNNGFSKSWNAGHFQQVFGEIERQVWHVYENYERASFYPDSTQIEHKGYITKPDIEETIRITEASLPRTRFLYNLVMHFNPRKYRVSVPIQRKWLVEWSSNRTYNRFLRELAEKGITKRGSFYTPGVISKNLTLNWKYQDSSHAIKYDGRSVEEFESAIRITYSNPRDFRQLLEGAGAERTAALKTVQSIFGKKAGVKKAYT